MVFVAKTALQSYAAVKHCLTGDVYIAERAASEKLEIIKLRGSSYLPAKQTLDRLGVPRTTFYRPLLGIFDALPVNGNMTDT